MYLKSQYGTILLFLIIPLAALGGCVENQDEAETSNGLTMAGLTECDYRYNGSVYVGCSNEVDLVELVPDDPPVGGICSRSFGSSGFHEVRLLWYPAENRLVLHMLPGDNLVSNETFLVGSIVIQNEDNVDLFQWAFTSREGYLELPETSAMPENPLEPFQIGFVVQGLVWMEAPQSLKDGEFDIIWSMNNDTLQPTFVVNAENETYFLPTHTIPLDGFDVYLRPFILTGQDYYIIVGAANYAGTSEQDVVLFNPLAEADCRS